MSGKSGRNDEVGALEAYAGLFATIFVVTAGGIVLFTDRVTGPDDVDDAAFCSRSVGVEMPHGAIALSLARMVDAAAVVTSIQVRLRRPKIAPERAFDVGKIFQFVTVR